MITFAIVNQTEAMDHDDNDEGSYLRSDDFEQENLAIKAPSVDENADLFAEGEARTIVLKPREAKAKSRDPEAYLSVDIWGLARSGNLDAMKDYIRDENYGTEASAVERKDKLGNTALHWATIEGHMHIIEYLLFCNANRHAQNKKGWTPLHCAVSLGRVDITARLIIDPGSHRSIRDYLGNTPLHEAVRANKLECVKLLVEEGRTPPGADRNAMTLAGNTPMHYASFLGFTDIVLYLLSQNADCNIRNGMKQFAVDVAHTAEIRDILQEATTIKKKCCWYCCYPQ